MKLPYSRKLEGEADVVGLMFASRVSDWGMHLLVQYMFVLEGCISQYITLLYYRDASLYIHKVLYWRDASPNTLDHCITEMHLSIH